MLKSIMAAIVICQADFMSTIEPGVPLLVEVELVCYTIGKKFYTVPLQVFGVEGESVSILSLARSV